MTNLTIATLRRKFSRYGLRILRSKHFLDKFYIETCYGREVISINTTHSRLSQLIQDKEWCEYWRKKNADNFVEIYKIKPEIFWENSSDVLKDVQRMNLTDFPEVVEIISRF